MKAEQVNPGATKSFGARHREIRRARKLPQIHVAKEYGISQGQLSKLENGLVDPKEAWPVRVAKISKVLRVTPERLGR